MKQVQFELLRENPKALQFLHEAKQFDFEKDFVILKIENNFTFNSVTKEIQKHISGDYVAAILLKATPRKCCNENLYFIDMDHSKFYPLRENVSLQYWKYNIDWFFGVGDFEETRKKKTDHIFVIAQKIEFLTTEKEKAIDYSQRFIFKDLTRAGDGRGNTYISKLNLIKTDGSNEKITFSPCMQYTPLSEREKTLENIIDKSGYILTLHRNDLKRRAKALKTEREKNKFLESDFSKENAALHEKIENVKKIISEKVLQVKTYDDATNLDKAVDKFRWMMMDFENHNKRIENKTFSSVKAVENSFTKFENYFNQITSLIEGWII